MQKILADNSGKENLTEFARKEVPKYEAAIRNLDSLEGRCLESFKGIVERIGQTEEPVGEDEIRNLD